MDSKCLPPVTCHLFLESRANKDQRATEMGRRNLRIKRDLGLCRRRFAPPRLR
jgi:hypothetical protein